MSACQNSKRRRTKPSFYRRTTDQVQNKMQFLAIDKHGLLRQGSAVQRSAAQPEKVLAPELELTSIRI